MSTVLILGATSDMAFAIAKKFAQEKYNLQLAGRDMDQLQAIQSDISIRYDTTCSVHHFDALQSSLHKNFFDQLNPKPDIVISVVGAMYDEEASFNNWDMTKQMIDTNFTGLVSILNIVAQYFITRKEGIIVGISSVAGERGRQSKLIYGSSKAAFSAYLSGLRNKLYKDNVHVLTVKPGFVYTKMTEDLKLPKLLTAYPDEVAVAVCKGVKKKKNTIYVKWFWKWIMFLIKNIPEFKFKKMKL